MGANNFTCTTEFILAGLSNVRETQILLFGIILLIYSLTLVGNLGVILIIWADSHLHTPMYFFLTHLSSLELCYVTSTEPQMLAHLLMGHGGLSIVRCALQTYAALALGSAEALLLDVMAYDRYLAICRPLNYATIMGRGRQAQLSLAPWMSGICVAAACVSISFTHRFCSPCHINHFICEIPMVMKLACDDTHTTEAVISLFAGLVIMIPFSVILVSYGLILLSVLQMRSVGGMLKAFSTCGSHLLVVVTFYGTTTLNYMIPQSGRSPDIDKQIAVLYVVVTLVLNPIIYTLRNKDVHRAMVRMLQRSGFATKR